jgi:hypothetical protein
MIVLPIMRIGARTRVERYMTMNCSDQTSHMGPGNTQHKATHSRNDSQQVARQQVHRVHQRRVTFHVLVKDCGAVYPSSRAHECEERGEEDKRESIPVASEQGELCGGWDGPVTAFQVALPAEKEDKEDDRYDEQCGDICQSSANAHVQLRSEICCATDMVCATRCSLSQIAPC